MLHIPFLKSHISEFIPRIKGTFHNNFLNITLGCCDMSYRKLIGLTFIKNAIEVN